MYSQGDEEKFLWEFFGKYHPHYQTFCDIGAFDGKGHSNTRKLFEAGWNGVLVEPDPNSFARLQANYANCKNIKLIQTAVGNISKRSRKITINIPADSRVLDANTYPYVYSLGEYSTCIDQEKGRWPFITNWSKITVDLTPLSEILPPKTDFLSIDCEGMDYEALESANLTEPNLPMLIMVEDNQNPIVRKQCDDYLKGFGYKMLHNNSTNTSWGKI